MSYLDNGFRTAINTVFDAYDQDKSGAFDPNEIISLINDALNIWDSKEKLKRLRSINLLVQLTKI